MSTVEKTSPQDRLLEATAALSYRGGVGVGIEALCKAAGVSKRSMYQLFESKDELLATSLQRGARAFVAGLLPNLDDDQAPRARILHVFEQLEVQAASPDYWGCPYLSAQVELKDQSHPASRVAREVKANLVTFFQSEAGRGGAKDPDLTARQLAVVFDGASARAGIGVDDLAGLLVPTVAALLDAAGCQAESRR